MNASFEISSAPGRLFAALGCVLVALLATSASAVAQGSLPRSEIVAQNNPLPTRVDVAQLKGLVPDRIGAWQRKSFSVPLQQGHIVPIDGPTLVSQFQQGRQHAVLTIADMGSLSGMAAGAQWSGEPSQRETASGSEKVYREGTHTVRETLDRQTHQRELALILVNGIVVSVKSEQADFPALKALADGVAVARAEALVRPAK